MSRPRSQEADEAIVDAAIALLCADGFDRVSMEAVATKAGVGKATIYRRWPSKEALVIDAVARRTDPFPIAVHGPVRGQLVTLLLTMLSVARTEVGRLLPCMVGASVSNPALARHYREQILEPRRARIGDILRAGVAAGELRTGLDIDLAVDQIVGPLLYRIVFPGAEPVDPAYCEDVVDSVLRGIAA